MLDIKKKDKQEKEKQENENKKCQTFMLMVK